MCMEIIESLFREYLNISDKVLYFIGYESEFKDHDLIFLTS